MIKRVLIGIVLTVLIIAGGLAAGLYYKTVEPSVKDKAAQLAESLKPAPKENLTLYTLSPPSRGNFITKVSVSLPPADGLTQVIMDEENGKDVRSGQNVVIYDNQGKIVNAIGKVKGSAHGTGENEGKITADIEVKTAWNESPDNVVRGDIIVERQSGVPRLPLISLQKDEAGNEYVWESVLGQDGSHTVYRKPADVALRNRELVGLNIPITSSNVFVLNPDENLQEGQKINAVDVFYSPPSEPNDAIIEATLVSTFPPLPDGTPYDPASRFGLKVSDFTCEEERVAASGQVQAGKPPTITIDFISKIRELSATLPISQ